MAKKQVRKMQMQTEDTIFALDIGTRSIIGMVGTVENDKVKIVAIEKEDHSERAMIDGQIENIEKVSALAGKIKKRLEDKLSCRLSRVCVAAAGRALRTKRAEYELELPGTQLIDDELISRLEAGAITRAEEAFDAETSAEDDSRRFYLVGYTVCHYYLDQYMISSLKDHRGKRIKVDLIATFLPSEVVESLYTTMNKIGLEVASITLEPIAAINAAIPENLRLLNLVMVDIGAGTSDIASCTGGSVTGYTMATVAGDEVTETIMKQYLVDFGTAESMKAQMDQEKEISFVNILGMTQTTPREELLKCIQGTSETLCKEIAGKILEVNGGPPAALFLAGGGSKLAGLKEGLTIALQMDANYIAIAGSNFQANAYSEEYDLNNPEYATPLGIAISSGLNLINDSFRVILNNRPAKLFRSGSFTALNLLMMNGYNFQDILGRTGLNLTVTVNGKRKTFYAATAQPATLLINKKEGKLSEIIHAGDCIDFEPAIPGVSAQACLGDIEGAHTCLEITLNGAKASLKTPLKNGDVIQIKMAEPEAEKTRPAKTRETEVEVDSEKESYEEYGKRYSEMEAEAQTKQLQAETDGIEAGIGTEIGVETEIEAGTETGTGIEETGTEMTNGESAAHNGAAKEAEQPEQPENDPALPVQKLPVPTAAMARQIASAAVAEQKEPAGPVSETTVPKTTAAMENNKKTTMIFPRVEIIENTENNSRASDSTADISDIQQTAFSSGGTDAAEKKAVGEEYGETDISNVPEPETIPGDAAYEPAPVAYDLKNDTIPDSAVQPESAASIPASAETAVAAEYQKKITFYLNDAPISLPYKEDGEPYYLMDMIQYSGIDLAHPKGTVTLSVNGEPGMFQQELMEGDHIRIVEAV